MFDGNRVGVDRLQLPLYVKAVAADSGEPRLCGYFNLPNGGG